ncbi:MAG: hypothetical protein MUP53_06210 [Bacteroidales bacterium]|nr:hypothetical protein [Bacteroidales bacterium]
MKIENEQLNYLDSLYIINTGVGKDFINGRDYIRYFFQSVDNPLLRSEEMRSASLISHGRKIRDIVLNYDTFTDQVILTDKNLILNNKVCEVALNSDNISRFDIYFEHDTLTFRYFGDRPGLKEGYYEVVYDGVCKYLIKHVSSFIILEGMDRYTYTPIGYVLMADQVAQIGPKEQFLRLFGKASAEIREFVHERKIRLRRADKKQIAEILRFYESLQTTTR